MASSFPTLIVAFSSCFQNNPFLYFLVACFFEIKEDNHALSIGNCETVYDAREKCSVGQLIQAAVIRNIPCKFPSNFVIYDLFNSGGKLQSSE